MSRDDFGRLLTFGVAAMILFAAVANLGANLTLLPVTGIPLPFISYGRTSLLTNLAALGIATNRPHDSVDHGHSKDIRQKPHPAR